MTRTSTPHITLQLPLLLCMQCYLQVQQHRPLRLLHSSQQLKTKQTSARQTSATLRGPFLQGTPIRATAWKLLPSAQTQQPRCPCLGLPQPQLLQVPKLLQPLAMHKQGMSRHTLTLCLSLCWVHCLALPLLPCWQVKLPDRMLFYIAAALSQLVCCAVWCRHTLITSCPLHNAWLCCLPTVSCKL